MYHHFHQMMPKSLHLIHLPYYLIVSLFHFHIYLYLLHILFLLDLPILLYLRSYSILLMFLFYIAFAHSLENNLLLSFDMAFLLILLDLYEVMDICSQHLLLDHYILVFHKHIFPLKYFALKHMLYYLVSLLHYHNYLIYLF
ncbi:hypothetical protein D3C71_1655830 [compost metagenome]